MANHKIELIRQAEAHIDENVTDPVAVVEKAIRICRDMVESASREISQIRTAGSGVGEDIDAIKQAWYNSTARSFPIWFGWDESNPDRSLQKLELRFNEIFQRIDKGLNIKCRPKTGRRAGLCKNNGFSAYQSGGSTRPRKFHLCPKFFNQNTDEAAPDISLDIEYVQAATIAHELCHAVGGLGTVDLQDETGSKLYKEARALAFAANEPERAVKSASNIDQFLLYRERVKQKTAEFIPIPPASSSGTDKWAGVPERPDAIVRHPNGRFYFFRDNEYWRYNPAKREVEAGPRVIGEDGFKGVPKHIDAAINHPINGKLYFFKGKRYWRFDPAVGVNKVDHSDVRTIGSTGWKGLLGGIHAAVLSPDKRHAVFFYGIRYRIFDFAADRAGPSLYLRNAEKWEHFGKLYGHFNAAVLDDFNDKGNPKGHFFTDGHYQVDDMKDYTIHLG